MTKELFLFVHRLSKTCYKRTEVVHRAIFLKDNEPLVAPIVNINYLSVNLPLAGTLAIWRSFLEVHLPNAILLLLNFMLSKRHQRSNFINLTFSYKFLFRRAGIGRSEQADRSCFKMQTNTSVIFYIFLRISFSVSYCLFLHRHLVICRLINIDVLRLIRTFERNSYLNIFYHKLQTEWLRASQSHINVFSNAY